MSNAPRASGSSEVAGAHGSTLHVLRTRGLGEFAALALRARLALGDSVLTLGPAALARSVSQLLGTPVRNRPVPRWARASNAEAIARGLASRLGSAGVRHGVETGEVPDFGGLPTRAAARGEVGIGDAIAVAPLTDRPEAVDARALLFVAGVLEIVGERVALILPERARRLDEALTYLHNAGHQTKVRIVAGAWSFALPAADVFVEPADADDDPGRAHARALAGMLGVPIAPTAAWRLDPDAATHSLPVEIRATVAPVLRRARALRAGGRGPVAEAGDRGATVPA
jgi:hypothetical protein